MLGHIHSRLSAKHRSTGSGLAEVAGSGVVLVIMAIFAINICALIFAYGINDRACRDAARAAAQADSSRASAAAKAALSQHKVISDLMISPPAISNFTYTDFGGNPPVGKVPFVSVATTALVRLLAPLPMLPGQVKVSKQYTFPIVRLKPPGP